VPTFTLAVCLRLAAAPGDDALALSGSLGAVQEVVAMDDERQLVWRAEP
jgi:hypothetical protein